MFPRQIGNILRGQATPLHLMIAAVLGALLGFVPGFWAAPGLIIALVLLLIVMNANLAAAAIIGLLAKLVSFALLPISFAIGQFLLDGPLQGLFKWMVNAPVLALFGFERYLVSGALITGLAFGVVCGLILIRIVTGFRRKMVSFDQNHEKMAAFTSKGWVKLLMFIFIGGRKGKATYAELAEKKFGNPIRIPGVILAVLVIGLLIVFQSFLSGPILTAYLHQGLERANGATVDLGNAEVDLANGRMTIDGLAMADRNALDTDLLRAAKVEADISATDLLRKRAQIDRIVLSDATSGEKRVIPGRIVGPVAPPLPPDPGADKTIDDYIADAKLWKERLAQIRQWLEKISGSDTDEPTEAEKEALKDRIARQIRESGYASVIATHLLEDAPSLVITELIADGVKTVKLEGEVLDIRGENLSTHPHLLAQKPKISVKSRSDRLALLADFAEGAATGGSANQLQFKYLGLPVDAVSKSLAIAGNPSPISGGTMDIQLNGQWASAGVGFIDMPLNVTLHNTTVTLPAAGNSANVALLPLMLGLKGPMENPRIHLDDKQFADALTAAGASALASHVRGEADKAIDKAKEDAAAKIGEKIDEAVGEKAKGLLGDLLPGKDN